ncbi:MAG TPA: ABC transporter permease [Bryobacteraceae bacterium]|nr:ABC transporter permease [Bryobacteraceae bacterium]
MSAPISSWLARAGRRVRFRWQRDRLDRELREELAFHLAQIQAEDNGAGLARFGSSTLAHEQCRDLWSFMSLERFWQDLRYAMRMYARTPVFTGVSILSLALGIGGNAAMLSLINTLLVRPLPYSQPERLLRITGIFPRAALPFFQTRSHSMEIAAVSVGSSFNLTGEGSALRVTGSFVSPNFLSVLGAYAEIGRSFRPGEELPGSDSVVILSHGLWRERFAADPGILGRVIQLDGAGRQVVGIMPDGFAYPSSQVQLWVPMRLDPARFAEYWGTEFVPLLGRLQPGASLAEAQAESRSLVTQFRGTFPYPMARDWNADSTVIPLQRDIVGEVRGKLIILLSSVALVLLIACANVASLLLSRATTRRRELALRAALGAGKARIVRQLLTESVGLALAGAGLGVLVGSGALSIFKSLLPASMPGMAQAAIDWQVVLAVSVLAVATGLASGLAPALSASQVDLAETIRTGGQRASSGFWSRVRGLIVAGEVALTLVLLVSAGLLLRSLAKLSSVDLGFDPARVLAVQISPNPVFCAGKTGCLALYDRLLERAAAIPGVRDAAAANSVPLDGQVPTVPVDVEDHPRTVDHPSPMLWFGAVSPEYFRVLNVSLLGGRYLTRADSLQSAPVALISASAARHFWPNQSAIGKHIRPSSRQAWSTIVGVVADVRHYTLSQGLPGFVPGAIYMPYAQSAGENGQMPTAMTLLASVHSDDARTRNALQRLAEAQDPNLPVGRVRPAEEIVSGSIADFRSTMRVFLGFALAGIVLASVGIYGLMSYWVSQRAYEIGLRVAIGATRTRILALILGQGMKITAYGVIGGILVAVVLTRFLAAFLYQVEATDLLTFAVVVALVTAVAAIATAFPAWRATRIDPVKSLRAD